MKCWRHIHTNTTLYDRINIMEQLTTNNDTFNIETNDGFAIMKDPSLKEKA